MPEPSKRRGSVDNFAARLGYLVRKRGGAASLARAADVSDRVVGKWKAGESEPTVSRLVALARAAGVSVEWLATGRGAVDDQIYEDPALYCEEIDPELVAQAAGDLHELVREHGIEMSAQEVRMCVKAAASLKARERGKPMREVIRGLL